MSYLCNKRLAMDEHALIRTRKNGHIGFIDKTLNQVLSFYGGDQAGPWQSVARISSTSGRANNDRLTDGTTVGLVMDEISKNARRNAVQSTIPDATASKLDPFKSELSACSKPIPTTAIQFFNACVTRLWG